ncbi:hypothetical protein K440DRAFT_663338 [Wilcoxina mikolae CBS 423.85]|nr:hypothetical protein K440DRAFT_663338 [Wilcoxina mikolae CBS 423.85]
MTPLTQSDGPMGLSPCGQKASYVIAVIICFLGMIARFWSYKGDRKYMSEIPRLRWLGDASVVISFVIFFTVTVIQFKLLDMTIDKGALYGESMDSYIYVLKVREVVKIPNIIPLALKQRWTVAFCFPNSLQHVNLYHESWIYLTLRRALVCFLTEAPKAAVGNCGNDYLWLHRNFLAYPLITIIEMHILPSRKLLYLIMVALTGIWPAVTATYRFYLVVQYLDSKNSSAAKTSPQSTIALASMFEMASLLISVSFPQYRVLRRKLWASPRFQKAVLNPIRNVLASIESVFRPAPPAKTPARTDTWETGTTGYTVKSISISLLKRQHQQDAAVGGGASNRDSQNSQNPFRDVHSVGDVGDSSWSEEADMEKARARRHSFEQVPNSPAPFLRSSGDTL